MTAPFDSAEFRRASSMFATGVAVVTARHGDTLAGMTINSFASVSLDPPLVLWCLKDTARSRPVYEAAGRFAINILAADQIEQARHFSRNTLEAFDGVTIEMSPRGLPLLPGALAHFECTTEFVHEGGDHRILVGRVVALDMRPGTPLLFFRGHLSAGQPELEPTGSS